MNFFERQDKARALTLRLVLMFILAVVLTILAVHTLVSVVWGVLGGGEVADSSGYAVQFDEETGEPIVSESSSTAKPFSRVLCDPGLFTLDMTIVGGLILCASLFRFMSLSAGGPEGVVSSLGGTPLNRGTSSNRQRRLYNVVEEIAIASGSPVPKVYILENEPGINACAIGTSPDNAAICVTNGALELLNRDELQGVVAHEFSHIVNSDMRLNMRLIGVLFGIELISTIALMIIRTMLQTRPTVRSSDDDSKGSGAVIVVFLIASIVLYLIGVIGVVFGNIIRAAISRQREYLADASAVQFTRNPDGIAGALKKIGCPHVGSAINSKGSEQTSHMFFGSVFKSGFFQNLYKTHPNLVDRIKAIDPNFDGRFPEYVDEVSVGDEELGSAMASGFQSASVTPRRVPVPTISVGTPEPEGARVVPPDSAALYGDWAKPAQEREPETKTKRIRIAPTLLESVPTVLDDVLVDAAGAKATIYAVLFSRDPAVRAKQTALLRQAESPEVLAILERASAAIDPLAATTRLLVVRVATPLIKSMTVDEYRLFRKLVVDFCAADGRLDLFEYTLQNETLRELDVYYRLARPIEVRYSRFGHVAGAFRTVLACLAYEGAKSVEDARGAFAAGCEVFGVSAELLERQSYSLASFTKALNELAHSTPSLKKPILEACWKCVLCDGEVTERESALLSAVTSSLGVPAPVWKEWTS